jgi:hypothetical protein
MINGLSHGVGEQIEEHMTELGPVIVQALNNAAEDTIQRLACGIVSDVASNIGSRMNIYLDDFIKPLI